jgi:hypothetical protein
MEGMRSAERELMMASGQYEATFSEQGNEISGVSIEERQKQGDRVTFHFHDNLAKAIRYTGKQLIDLIPKIYDTRRVIRIMDESGEEQQIKIDPEAKRPLQQTEDGAEAKVAAIFNPKVGTYDVVAKVGPNFETRRQKAFEAQTQLLTAQPMLANVIGDIYMGTADFPAADKLQERMRNWIKATNPGILGDGPTPSEIQLQTQLKQAMQIIQELHKQVQDKSVQQELAARRLDMDALNHLALRMENDNKQMKDAYEAFTKRLQVLFARLGDEAVEPLARQFVADALGAPSPDAAITPDPIDPANLYAAEIQEVLQPIEPQNQPE